ncbi:MAG TPA: hypothetical protein VJP78_12255 [Thermoleophilia bacterium]|nr:hypothetical protein [Thermoleophilia bacterium]
MHKRKLAGMAALFVAVMFAAVLLIGLSSALAVAPPVADGEGGTAFLCPAVGGPNAGGPLPGGQNTFLPGHNQAGLHANYHGWNGNGGPGDSPGPGNGNSNWSPIWAPAD